MNEAAILAKTYRDRAVFIRKRNIFDENTGAYRQEDVTAAAVCCALSAAGGVVTQYSKTHGGSRRQYRLFVPPGTDVQLGDRAVVHTAAGQKFTLFCGQPLAYPSHAEVALSLEDGNFEDGL